MNKFFKKIILIVLYVEFAFSTSLFASINNNDKDAFMTKAEFDTLKNSFQSQIDSFNANIDSKIDSAISAYLAGIKTDNERELVSLIDDNGTYGGKINMAWSSSTNYRMISSNVPRAIGNWTQYNCTYITGDYSSGTNPRPVESRINTYDAIWNTGNLDYQGNPVSNYDAGTKKVYRVETVKIDGTDYRMLRYVKVVNYIESNQFCGFPTNYDNPTASGAVASWYLDNMLDLNISECTQENLLKGLKTDYYRPTSFSSNKTPYIEVIKTGNTMITQNYEENFEHVFAPFSTIQEYVWDPDSKVTLSFSGNLLIPNTLNRTGRVAWFGTGGRHNADPRQGRPHIPNNLYFAWQHLLFKDGARNESGNNVQAKDSIICNYYDIDNRNLYQKNGLVLGTIPNSDNVEIICECNADVAGTVYFHLGDRIENWTSSDFDGKKYTLVANTLKKCSLGSVTSDTLKNKPIWVVFAPTDTSIANTGKFKVSRLYYKIIE